LYDFIPGLTDRVDIINYLNDPAAIKINSLKEE
jgi:hypothetical protein